MFRSSHPLPLFLASLLFAAAACDLGIQSGVGRVETDEADMIAQPPAAQRSERAAGADATDSTTLPALVADPSGLLGLGAERLLLEARRHPGKALLVNFWASFCGSCRQELPMLREIADEFGPQGVGLRLISADEPQDRTKAAEILRGAGITGPSYHVEGGVGSFKERIEARWKGALPATVLLDTEGRVRHFWRGPVLARELRPVVEGYLRGEDVDGVTNTAGSPD